MVTIMKYPTGVNKQNKIVRYGNRGMNLENDINETNTYYLNNNIAVIYKKPTPITITKVNYHSRQDAMITEAYFKTPSTTDYNGIYKGKYIDFEAKETKLSYFPLRNIHTHQIEHLKKIVAHGGIGFLIVHFSTFNKTYYLSAEKLFEYLDTYVKKTIPFEYFEKEGYLIKMKINPRIDYISIIDKIYFKGESV